MNRNGLGSQDDFSERDDIEMSFIRTLSVNGLILSGALSAEDRRERIRIAIFQQRLNFEIFADRITFAQAYERCYKRSLELRRVKRDEHHRPMGSVLVDEDDIDNDDAEDDHRFKGSAAAGCG